MITDFLNFVYPYELAMSFVCHTVIFLGGLYSAIHSRMLPQWTATCIWYIGLASLFNSIIIIFDWTLGPAHPMAYSNLGLLGSALQHVALAVSVAILFVNTLWKDIVLRKNRNIR